MVSETELCLDWEWCKIQNQKKTWQEYGIFLHPAYTNKRSCTATEFWVGKLFSVKNILWRKLWCI